MPVDEIVVRGRSLEPRFPTRGGFPRPSLIVGGGQSTPPGGVLERNPPIDRGEDPPPFTPPDPDVAFVPPVVPPQLLPEVTVIGRAPARAAFGFGRVAKFNLASIVASVGGLLVAAILKDRGEALLEREFAELMARGRIKKRGTPTRTIPEQTIPEIVVKASRRSFIRSLFVIPQTYTFISVDTDPFEMQTIQPRFLEPAPAPATIAIEIPELPDFRTLVPAPVSIPVRSPATVPLIAPQVRPGLLPATMPQTVPSVQPFVQPAVQPGLQPAVQPSIGTQPLTRVQTRVLPSTRAGTRVQPRAGLGANLGTQNCPPCTKKKERKKPRTECYKKLVKEGVTEDLDQSYNWVKIDCLSGREL